MRSRRKRTVFVSISAIFFTTAVLGLVFYFVYRIQSGVSSLNEDANVTLLSDPVLRSQDLIEDLQDPKAIVFASQELMIFGEKNGKITAYVQKSGEKWQLHQIEDVTVDGERGLQGLAVDRNFFDNRYIYACYSASSPEGGQETRVSRWVVSQDFLSLTKQLDIVTGIENSTSKNQGCALEMDNIGYLWVATSDTGNPSAAQDPKSLGGKVLRILRDGNPAEGNLGSPFDPRVYSFGHRNSMGITLLESPLLNGAYGFMTERGGVSDDEVNFLQSGNFGWDPNQSGSYNDAAPMTDNKKFSAAIKALWSSGKPVSEVGSIERLARKRWQSWQNNLLIVGRVQGSTRLLTLAADNSIKTERKMFNEYGSLAVGVESPDGNLYLATANGNGKDKIIKVEVVCTVCE
jgi:glucose/arabinose dehydrogenase